MDYINRHKKTELIQAFHKQFNIPAMFVLRSSGRMELLGNHTDHQGGKVLVSAINLFIYGAVSTRDDLTIHFHSEGFENYRIDLHDLSINPTEFSTSKSLIRGIAARLLDLGYKIGGLNIYVKSDVPLGSGVSSSAGFEMLIVEIFNQVYNQQAINPLIRAMIGQYAENHYFNKPSGLLDQMGVSLGGINYIDFYHTDPLVFFTMDNPFKDIHFILINTGGSHANLTPFYQAIRHDMETVAHHFKKQRLSELDEGTFFKTQFPSSLSPLSIKRATHYFQENNRVEEAKDAINNKNLSQFLSLINASGRSSESLLENITFPGDKEALLLRALTYLKEAPVPCAYRVHGGGFAGTMLVVVTSPFKSLLLAYLSQYFNKDQIMDVLPVLTPILSEKIYA
jgi:galactokinase